MGDDEDSTGGSSEVEILGENVDERGYERTPESLRALIRQGYQEWKSFKSEHGK